MILAEAEEGRPRRSGQWNVPISSGAKPGAALTTEKSTTPQPQREGSSIASPQQRKKRKQAASTDLASAQAQLTVFTRTPGPSLVSGRVIPGPRSYSSSEA